MWTMKWITRARLECKTTPLWPFERYIYVVYTATGNRAMHGSALLDSW